MKLMLQVKLLPSVEQGKSLLNTIKTYNEACNEISHIAWENKEFNQYRLHQIVYYKIKEKFNLTAPIVIRCISKVANAYKVGKHQERRFKLLGAITYDSRILSYRKNSVSIWSVDGRLRMPIVCHNPKYFSHLKGEADLITRKGKFYLFQTVDIPEEDIKDVEGFVGLDFGIVNLAVTSDGKMFSGKESENVRKRATAFKRKLQKCGSKSAKRHLIKYSGKERRFKKHINHEISKQIVNNALKTRRGIALEDLKGFSPTVRKAQREMFGKWSFFELRQFIEYKAKLVGIPVFAADPRYTSQA
ncbi:IS200/IS605 family accessory protein TnpB-related protein, partial [Patescibacteria group bacterium]|nr:IS200/IS605 family accessory protein TnpB-related protein [Patescibacteria group bacterium]